MGNKQDTQQILDELAVAEERQVYISTPSGKLEENKAYKAIWNLNTKTLGCIASNGYNIIQHREVVSSLLTALNNLNINYTFDVRSDGHRMFFDVKFPDTRMLIKKGEEFIGGLRLVNSFDKTTGLLIMPRMERLVCSNGMILNHFITGFSIRHNQKLVEDFQIIVEKSINNMINSSSVLKAMINKCLEDSVEWKFAERILFNLLHRKKHVEAIIEILKKEESVTRWDIYNSITQYATHGAQLKPSVENWLQNKAQSLLETELEELNIEVPEIEVK